MSFELKLEILIQKRQAPRKSIFLSCFGLRYIRVRFRFECTDRNMDEDDGSIDERSASKISPSTDLGGSIL